MKYIKFFFSTIFFLLFFSGITLAQNKEAYFKTIPNLNGSEPAWVSAMYSKNPNVWEVSEAYELYYKNNDFVKTTHTQNYKYWVRKVEDLLDNEGFIRPKNKESNTKKRQKNTQVLERSLSSPWRAIGPFETYRSGVKASWQAHVDCISVCQADKNVLYAGAAAGSLFKSTDKGENWLPITYGLAVRGIKRVAVSPLSPDIVYFAESNGVWLSTDGGNTWEKTLNVEADYNHILINPLSPQIVYIGSSEGLYRTDDGGNNWTQVSSNKCWDIDFQPNNPSTVYATFHNETTNISEFWKSTDNGITFSLQNNGWFSSIDANKRDGGSRIAVTPVNPNRVYVVLVGEAKTGDDGWIGVYKSDDAGNSWINSSGQDGGPYAPENSNLPWNVAAYSSGYHQGFFNLDIAASHNNADLIWVGTVRLVESTDGGASFTSIGAAGSTRHENIHADIQEIIVTGNEIWVTSDGGIDYSTDELQSHVSTKNGINASEFWGFDNGQDLDILIGGRYHNGNTSRHPNYNEGDFQFVAGAEKATGYVDAADNTRIHFSDIWSSIVSAVINMANQWLYSFLDLYPNESYTPSESSEMVYDINTPTTVYIGNNAGFYKSTNSGTNYTLLYEFNNGNGKVREIEQSQQNANKFYAIFFNTDNANNKRGEIYKTLDGGNTWQLLSNLPAATHRRVEIAINPNNDEELWVANVDGDMNELIFKTSDGGNTWQNLTSISLGDIALRDIVFIEATNTHPVDRIYLAADNALFYKQIIDSDWTNITDGMPTAFKPLQLRYHKNTQLLRLATRGHAIWELNIAQKNTNFIASGYNYEICGGEPIGLAVEIDGIETHSLSFSNGFVSNCSEIIPQSTSININDNAELVSNFCGNSSGFYYVDLELMTNCYNKSASFKGFVNLTNSTIDVLEYYHFGASSPSDMTGSGSNIVVGELESYAQFSLELIGNNLYFAMTKAPCGASSIIRIENGNFHETNYYTATTTSYTATIAGNGNTINEEIIVKSSNPSVEVNNQVICADATTALGVEVDGVSNYTLNFSNGFTASCTEIIEQGESVNLDGGDRLITDFCGNNTGLFYVDLEVFTNCYNETASFKGIVDLDNSTIDVIEYIHFAETTPSSGMFGLGTNSVTSNSAAFAQFEIWTNGSNLYIDMENAPCGASSWVRVNNGNTHSTVYVSPTSNTPYIANIVDSAGCTTSETTHITVLPDTNNNGACDDNCTINQACNDGDATTINDTFDENCNCIGEANIGFSFKILFEGFLQANGTMTTELNEANLIPNQQPFNKIPWYYSGTENLAVIPANMVDWVLINFYNAAENIIETKAAYVDENGNVFDINGTSNIPVLSNVNDIKYISIHQKSHLGVVVNTASLIANFADFTQIGTAIGIEQTKTVYGVQTAYSGDFDGNGVINNFDYNIWSLNSAAVNQYLSQDTDGNGITNSQDYNFWTLNRSKVGEPIMGY